MLLTRRFAAAVALFTCILLGGPFAAAQTTAGEIIGPEHFGPSVIESMADVIARDKTTPPVEDENIREPGETGSWVIPSLNMHSFPHSGVRNAVNKWGDTHMGIGFPKRVTVLGVYVASQVAGGEHTTGIRALGFRAGVQVAETPWFQDISNTPAWFEMNFSDVDRIELISAATISGGGWYSIDDLTYRDGAADAKPTVVGFDDLPAGTKLTGGHYADLTWEAGQGDYGADDSVHGPLVPSDLVSRGAARPPLVELSGTRATAPIFIHSFQGVLRGDAGSNSYPPDTCGAVGPNHFVIVVNRNVGIYNRTTGQEVSNVLLTSFQPGTNGDPRVLFDHHSGRWLILSTDFSAGSHYYLAVSLTNDPTGAWFKTSFSVDQGSDAGRWPDYPTMGVDANGIYFASYMVGGADSMTIFAVDKAPLIAPTPSLGTVTAFRNLPFEGAIQPAITYGNPGGEYLASWFSGTALRVRRVNPPLTGPTLTEVGQVTVPAFSTAPNAAAQGSSTPINTVDERLMMSMFRNGSLWTCHTIDGNGRAACRWYQINVTPLSLTQSGTVGDPVRHYYFPSLAVSPNGDVVMGFSGSSTTEFAGAYYTGRRASDPLGDMAAPVLYKAGLSSYNLVDSFGRNRWGDYSLTTVDPDDGSRIFTLQEYAVANTQWGTWAAELSVTPPDCNGNGVPDGDDIANGTSQDCNGNGIPDECEVPPLGNHDCNHNGIPDECDLASGTSADCNHNGRPDECDIPPGGLSGDCNHNGVPDECELGHAPFSQLYNLDTDPNWPRTAPWAFGTPTGQGGTSHGFPDPSSGATGSHVFGVNLNGDYATAIGGPYYLIAGPFNLTHVRDVSLRFKRHLNSDYQPFVESSIWVSLNGVSWQRIWDNGGTVIQESAWTTQTYSLPTAADQPTVYVRFAHRVGQGGAWPMSGWNIDDLELIGTTFGGPGDCNNNNVPDTCDIANGTEQDCNVNGVPDSCDIANGTTPDANSNGIPDICEPTIRGDMNCDGHVDFADIDPFVQALSGPAGYFAAYPTCHWINADCNEDGHVDFADIDPFVARLGGG